MYKKNNIILIIFFIFLFNKSLYPGTIKQEHFLISDINEENKINKPFYTFNMFFDMPVFYGIDYISDNRDFFYNSKHRFEKKKIKISGLAAGIDFSYCIKNAGLAYSLDQAKTGGANIDGTLIEPGMNFRFEGFNNSLMLEFYYRMRFNYYSANGGTPDNYTLPDENILNIFDASVKYSIQVLDSLDAIFIVDNTYAYADKSTGYGSNSEYYQLKKINILNPKSFIEYNKYPVLMFTGVSFIHSFYNSYYLGNVYSWQDRYENIIYAVPEKSVPVNAGFLNHSGFKFVNILDTPISVQIFNSLLIYNKPDISDNINRIINGFGCGIDIRTNFAALHRLLGFLNGNLLIGYMSSFEYINGQVYKISDQAFVKYAFSSKW